MTSPAPVCSHKLADRRAVCAGDLHPLSGARYCLLHLPADKKDVVQFDNTVREMLRLGVSSFRGVWFPAPFDFSFVEFTNADFTGATFKDANFFHAVFNGKAWFDEARFEGVANFDGATFGANGGVSFSATTFLRNASFQSTTFADRVNFRSPVFHREANFWLAGFQNYVRFVGTRERTMFRDRSRLEFRNVRVEHPELVSFHSLKLRAHWFVGADPRKFDFTKIEWQTDLKKEIEALSTLKEVEFPYELLLVACQRIATNYEENFHFEKASLFRYMVMDIRRLERWRGFDFRRLGWWYWLVSGYGERVGQAALVLIGIWIVFAAIFFFGQRHGQWWQSLAAPIATTPAVPASIEAPPTLPGFGEALIYSAEVMTLQKPTPLPANKRARALVLLETALGPIQAALLALAIRRKFMH